MHLLLFAFSEHGLWGGGAGRRSDRDNKMQVARTGRPEEGGADAAAAAGSAYVVVAVTEAAHAGRVRLPRPGCLAALQGYPAEQGRLGHACAVPLWRGGALGRVEQLRGVRSCLSQQEHHAAQEPVLGLSLISVFYRFRFV